MEEAVCLLQMEEDDQMKLTEQGVRMVKDIPEGYGVIPLTLVGPGRTGKSTLLNMLAKKNVFGTGSGVDRVTKGIWIYIKLENERNLAFVYIDVEGFGDPKQANVKGKNNRLLMVVSQICDVIMYNTKGVPDDSMLQKLGLVCYLFDKHRKQDRVLSKPILVVLLRDYDLDGMDSSDSEKSFRDILQKYAEGTCVNETFRHIEYVELVMPTERRKIRDLQNMSDEILDEDFVEKRNELETFIRVNAKPLGSESGNNLTGKVLAEVVRKTVQAVNSGRFEGLEQTLPDILKQQNERKMQEALQMFEKEMKRKWPATTAAAPETLAVVQTRTKGTIKEDLQTELFDIDKAEATLLKQFETQTESIFATMSKTKSKAELEEIKQTLETRINDNYYEIIGGHEKYCEDWQSAENKYKKLKNLGPMKGDVWKKYEMKLRKTEKLISEIDEAKRGQLEAETSERRLKMGLGILAAAAATFGIMRK